MQKEMPKTYDPHMEDEINRRWIERGYFTAKADKNKKPFTIVIPPPNITGQLHMGHALNNTIQDILIRAKRMQGYAALWVPGYDHAAIATEVRVMKELAKEGVTKESLGREGFLEKVWQWKEKYGGTIVGQLKRMGFSCDWSRERFTMDEGLSDAVLEVFVRLYGEGKIYRGKKLVNWCTKCQTTISDAEVEHEESFNWMYSFKYPVKGGGEFITFATTRPETMLGDTAVAVNPSDGRYAHLVGKTVTVPFVDRDIPVIADAYVEAEFGTGVVKITPAHDHNDYAVGERHCLPMINIMTDDGMLNENTGPYEGMEIYAAREKIIADMEAAGLYAGKESIKNAVGTHDRCGTTVEPLLKLQWFVKMEELAKPALDAYKSGELRFNRERFGRIYSHWLENIRDWCISRQLWWGHRIPAYYCECGFVTVSKKEPAACGGCGGKNLTQDPDTLDTWFSSALWPFSTLGWPQKTEDLEYFYPTDVLVTAYEIIFFWVVRMVFSGLYFMKELPFKDVLVTGMVLDSTGKKMSKSLGNGLDPIEVVDMFGADALRLMLVSGNALDNDTRFYMEKMEYSRNFLNKLWNASRFVLMNLGGEKICGAVSGVPADRWILSRLNTLVRDVTEKINAYELGMAAQYINDFIWDEFCDWYVEMVKPRLYGKENPTRRDALCTLHKVLITALKLLHPFTPFITEEIFLSLQSEEETIMLSEWPEFDGALVFAKEEAEIEMIKEAVHGVRNVRLQMQVEPAKKIRIIAAAQTGEAYEAFTNGKAFFAFLAGAESVEVRRASEPEPAEKSAPVVLPGAVLYLPLDALVDAKKERARLEAEKIKIEKELARVNGKLGNEGFTAKAPPELIAEENAKREKYSAMLAQTQERLAALVNPSS